MPAAAREGGARRSRICFSPTPPDTRDAAMVVEPPRQGLPAARRSGGGSLMHRIRLDIVPDDAGLVGAEGARLDCKASDWSTLVSRLRSTLQTHIVHYNAQHTDDDGAIGLDPDSLAIFSASATGSPLARRELC